MQNLGGQTKSIMVFSEVAYELQHAKSSFSMNFIDTKIIKYLNGFAFHVESKGIQRQQKATFLNDGFVRAVRFPNGLRALVLRGLGSK